MAPLTEVLTSVIEGVNRGSPWIEYRIFKQHYGALMIKLTQEKWNIN